MTESLYDYYKIFVINIYYAFNLLEFQMRLLQRNEWKDLKKNTSKE